MAILLASVPQPVKIIELQTALSLSDVTLLLLVAGTRISLWGGEIKSEVAI
jgi:hypothetical protein